MLNEYARAADPFSKIGAKTAPVEVISVVRAFGDSFEIRVRKARRGTVGILARLG